MNLKINKKQLKKALGASMIIMSTAVVGGCDAKTVTEDVTEIYSTIDSNDESGKIDPQVVDVAGEDFKLVIENSIDKADKKWRITSNKQILTKINTKGLPADTEVWIDNIHTDTYIISTTEEMYGIKQDSMDDHSHSEQVLGFPISDTISYYGYNEIEGQDKDFIEGSSYGFNGYSSGTIEQRRHSESEYLEETVYANEISSVYDLWVQKGNQKPYMTTAKSTIVVLVCNEVKKEEDGKVKVYRYDRNGEYTEVTGEK